MPRSFAARVSLILSAVAIIAVLATLAWHQFTPGGSSGPAAAIGGPFTLVDQDGQTVTDESLRGQYLLIYFGYSRRNSHLGKGLIEVHEDEAHDLAPHVPGIDDPDHRHA